jgi:subtilisin family serine protease
MKEYNVILHKGINYDEFWDDMESDTDGGKLYIPNRAVEFTNERPASLRQCWYLLTDEEAEILRADDRVLGVEIPPEHRTDIIPILNVVQYGDFTKTSSSTGEYINWGLIRSNSRENPYGLAAETTIPYFYTLTGTGVDVVIQDSGIQVDHPEFEDEDGNSRVQEIDWYTESGVSGTQNANHYRDYDGHGTHVAGITAGKRYGWAKNARIYSVKVSGLEGSGDSGTGISVTDCFDVIKGWHNNKPIDPKTGVKRPTVVNMSWGYGSFYNTVDTFNYRGSFQDSGDFDTAGKRENFGLINNSGFPAATYITNTRLISVDTDVDELIDAGVHVCIAAGNRGHKVDVSGGTDYNNYFISSGTTFYYHRGSSPYSTDAFMVGNMDSQTTGSFEYFEMKAQSSECGPGVDIYAAGTNIMSACSTTNRFGASNYYWDATFKQVNISGTSMASPQVAGICALLLEANPQATPQSIKAALCSNSSDDSLHSSGFTDDYTNRRSIMSTNKRIAHNRFGLSEYSFSVEGSGQIIDANLNLD